MIIDGHCHLGYMFALRPQLFPCVVGEDIVRIFDEHSIDKGVVFCTHYQGVPGYPYDADYSEANRVIHQEAKKFPDRIIPYNRVNPNFADRVVDQMKRGHEEYGFKGLKLHPLTDHFAVNDLTLMEPVMKYCADYKWPIFWHSGYYPTCQPALFAPLIDAFPDVNHVLGHIGYYHVQDCVVMAQNYKQVHIEPSGNGTTFGIRNLIDNIPITQIIYGDDIPFSIPTDVQDKFRYQHGLTEEDKNLILGGNMARLLGMEV